MFWAVMPLLTRQRALWLRQVEDLVKDPLLGAVGATRLLLSAHPGGDSGEAAPWHDRLNLERQTRRKRKEKKQTKTRRHQSQRGKKREKQKQVTSLYEAPVIPADKKLQRQMVKPLLSWLYAKCAAGFTQQPQKQENSSKNWLLYILTQTSGLFHITGYSNQQTKTKAKTLVGELAFVKGGGGA